MQEPFAASDDALGPVGARLHTRSEFAGLRRAFAVALADEVALHQAGYAAALHALQDVLRSNAMLDLLHDAYTNRAVDPVALAEAMELLADHHAIREGLVPTPPKGEAHIAAQIARLPEMLAPKE